METITRRWAVLGEHRFRGDHGLYAVKQRDAARMQKFTGTRSFHLPGPPTADCLVSVIALQRDNELLSAAQRDAGTRTKALTAAAGKIIKSKYWTSEISCRRSLNPYLQPFCTHQ